MSNVAKQIIIILVILLLGSVGMTVLIANQKSALEQDKAGLEERLSQAEAQASKLSNDNQSLDGQLKEAQSTKAKLQKQFSDLNNQVTQLANDRDNWKNQVDTLRRERDELMVKLQEKPKEVIVEKEVIKEVPSAAGVAVDSQDEYWASVLKEKASLELQIDELRSELSAATVEVEELKKTSSDLNMELSLFKSEKEEIARKIKYSEDLANTLSIDLAREKNDKRFLSDRQEKLREENLGLRAQVKELSSAKIALEKSIARIRGDKEKVEQKLVETESIIQNRIDEVLDLKISLDQRLKPLSPSAAATQSKEVELPPIIVSAASSGNEAASPQGTGLKTGFNGKVVSINEDNNFIIVDLGENAGVRIGDRLSVYRGEQYIAGVEIIQVRKDISAADIKQKSTRIKAGDSVR